jgi:hypothetical protein
MTHGKFPTQGDSFHLRTPLECGNFSCFLHFSCKNELIPVKFMYDSYLPKGPKYLFSNNFHLFSSLHTNILSICEGVKPGIPLSSVTISSESSGSQVSFIELN